MRHLQQGVGWSVVRPSARTYGRGELDAARCASGKAFRCRGRGGRRRHVLQYSACGLRSLLQGVKPKGQTPRARATSVTVHAGFNGTLEFLSALSTFEAQAAMVIGAKGGQQRCLLLPLLARFHNSVRNELVPR